MNKVVCWVILGFLIAAAVAAEEEEMSAKDIENVAQLFIAFSKCTQEFNITEEALELLAKQEVPETTEEKCFSACVMEALGMMKDGKLDREGSAKIMAVMKTDPEKLKLAMELMETCMDIEVPEDRCEAAGEYSMCMNEIRHI